MEAAGAMDDMVDLTGRDRTYAQRKYIAHKGWKTRLSTAITRSANLLRASYHPETVTTLRRDTQSLIHHTHQLKYISEWLEDNDHDADHKFGDDFQKVAVEVDKVLAISAEVIHAAPAAAAAAPLAAADIALKIANSLKPDKLRANETPQGFRSWKRKMQSYFEAAGIERLSQASQHAIIRSLIDVELEEAVGDKFDPLTPTFAPDGQPAAACSMNLLRDQIMLKHPLFIRRRTFLTHTLASGQSVAAWRTQHRQIGNEADLETLTTEELYCLTYVNALGAVPDLGDKILDCPAPTLAAYDALIEAYIKKQGVRSGLPGAPQQAVQAAAVKEKRPRESKEERSRMRECYERKICYVCGNTGHMAKSCRADKRQKCSKCKNIGHNEKACVKPAKARAVEAAATAGPREDEDEEVKSISRQAAQLALEYEEEPARLLAARGSRPTPPILL